jgi:hypothetical protein
VCVLDAEFEAILTRAAEEGAKRALADVGLDGDEAALDIRDLRSLIEIACMVMNWPKPTSCPCASTAANSCPILSWRYPRRSKAD